LAEYVNRSIDTTKKTVD